MMCMLPWIGVKFFPGGHSSMVGIINLVVHTIMYTYYFFALFYPEIRNSVLKKYVTQMQLVQFCLLLIHFSYPLIVHVEGCTYPKYLLLLGIIQNIIMLAMFGDFYIKTYHKANKQVKQ